MKKFDLHSHKSCESHAEILQFCMIFWKFVRNTLNVARFRFFFYLNIFSLNKKVIGSQNFFFASWQVMQMSWFCMIFMNSVLITVNIAPFVGFLNPKKRSLKEEFITSIKTVFCHLKSCKNHDFAWFSWNLFLAPLILFGLDFFLSLYVFFESN